MDRAYSLLNVKSVSEKAQEWVIEGVASTPTPDRQEDVIEPLGAKFKLPMALLWQHDSQKPVGRVEFARPTAKGIPYVAHLPKVAEPGVLKDRIDEAVQSIKYRLVAAVSIGFRAFEGGVERMKAGGLRFKEWEWLELSLVTIPANSEATITSIKSLDIAALAASGRSESQPGASGIPAERQSINRSPKGKAMKTLQELREDRNTKAARLQELVDLFKTDGHETTDEEGAEFDDLDTEVKALDTDIRVARFHATNAAAAKSVDGSNADSGSRSRGSMGFVKTADPEDKFKGQSFTRMVIAKAMALREGTTPGDYANYRWGKSNPSLVRWIKAGVPGGGTDSGEWGAELVGMDNRYTADFIEFLYGITVFDRLGLREAPRNVAVKGMDGAATAYWVGQSKAIPATTLSASTTDLTPLKVGALTVMSNELMADSSPGAEMLVRDALAEAAAQRIDQTFLSDTAASAGVSPAGILNGVTPVSSAGVDAAAFRTDFKGLYRQFITDKNTGGGGLVLVMNPSTAMALSLLTNALGQPEFNGVSSLGGMLINTRVVTGDNVDPADIILIKPGDIWKIGDSGVQVSVSREAMIEQDTAPSGATDTPVAASATMVSMFQEDSTAIKIVRRINFKKRRANAVTWINNADYDGVAS